MISLQKELTADKDARDKRQRNYRIIQKVKCLKSHKTESSVGCSGVIGRLATIPEVV